jgi:hypothetical protein
VSCTSTPSVRAPAGGTRRSARSSPTGARPDGRASGKRMRATASSRSRLTVSCRWRTRASEWPEFDRVDAGDLESDDGLLEGLVRIVERKAPRRIKSESPATPAPARIGACRPARRTPPSGRYQQRMQSRKALAPRVSRGESANGRRACFRPDPQQTTGSGRVLQSSSRLRRRSRTAAEQADGPGVLPTRQV